MLVGDLDDVQYELEVDGELVRRQLHRKVWQARGWATVAIAYEERAPDGSWKPAKIALLRMQHVREAWKKHATVTLAAHEARELAATLAAWAGGAGAEASATDDD